MQNNFSGVMFLRLLLALRIYWDVLNSRICRILRLIFLINVYEIKLLVASAERASTDVLFCGQVELLGLRYCHLSNSSLRYLFESCLDSFNRPA